jgi:hypothetical protein
MALDHASDWNAEYSRISSISQHILEQQRKP